jgi:iron uptake system component EfeO
MRLHRAPLRIARLSALACLTLGVAGCSDDDHTTGASTAADSTPAPSASASTTPASGGSEIAVAASDSACGIDKTSIPAGPVVLKIHNGGTEVTEVYILKDNGTGIVTERENIAPNSDTELTAELPQGSFQISCRPASGERVNSDLTVTGGSDGNTAEEQAAVDGYRAYVTAQVADTVAKTKLLVAALKENDLSKAKELYAPSRFGWESIEPVAEAFGDIDPKVDLREADLEEGATWTGWHVIEKQLWVEKNTEGMASVGDQLLADLDTLTKRVPEADITPTSMANGAKELLDEVASGKITGEEEAFSHTDLVDFKANLDGAKKVFDLLKPVAERNDADLVRTLDTEFEDCEQALSKYEDGETYISYDEVTEAQRKALSDAVNALAEPLSRLAAAVVG